MEKCNQLPKTEGCLAEGEPVDLRYYRVEQPLRSVPRETREPQAGPASCLSNSASKGCRGLRAWRARKETHGTEEAPNCPAARTARAKRVCRFNDKEKRQRQSGESDQLVVGHGKA